MQNFTTFEEIISWKKARSLNREIYLTTEEVFKKRFRFGKANQTGIGLDFLEYRRRV